MRSPDDSSDAPRPAARALDEFEHEDRADTTGKTTDAAGNIFVFDCEAQPPVEITVAGGLLDVAPALPTENKRPAPLSRGEARAAHHRRRRRSQVDRWGAAAAAWINRFACAGAVVRNGVVDGVTQQSKAAATASRQAVLRTSAALARAGAVVRNGVLDGSSALSRSAARVAQQSKAAATASRQAVLRTSAALAARTRNGVLNGSSALSRSAARVTHRSKDAAAASRHAVLRTSAALAARTRRRGPREMPTPATGTVFVYQETNGFVVAVLLAMTAVGYGSFLMGSWRGPTHTGAAAGAAGIERSIVLAPPAIVAAPGTAPLVLTGAPDPTPSVMAAATVAPPGAAFTPTAKTVTALWRRRDTRSLDQAFTALRQQTLAFHRCRMRMTETDRAVARCEGVATDGQSLRPVTWTIDFRRKAGRWAIGGLTAR